MNDAAVPVAIVALQKRRRRWRKSFRFSMIALITLAFTPHLFLHATGFALYGIAMFGALALLSNWVHGRVDAQLRAHGY